MYRQLEDWEYRENEDRTPGCKDEERLGTRAHSRQSITFADKLQVC